MQSQSHWPGTQPWTGVLTISASEPQIVRTERALKFTRLDAQSDVRMPAAFRTRSAFPPKAWSWYERSGNPCQLQAKSIAAVQLGEIESGRAELSIFDHTTRGAKMIPRVCCLMALFATLAAAQDQRPAASDPTWEGLPNGVQVVFYSGDFDPKNILANGLLNQNVMGMDGLVWVPFAVQKQITVDYLFIHELFTETPPQSAPAQWTISNGVSQGNEGKIQCSGKSTASSVPTGRSFQFQGVQYTEYRYVVKLANPCILTAGAPENSAPLGGPPPTRGGCPGSCSLSLSVQTGTVDAPALQGFLSDVEDNPPHHHIGSPNINDSSFFSSTAFGFEFQPTAAEEGGVCAMGSPLAISNVGCDMFSVGIAGSGQ